MIDLRPLAIRPEVVSLKVQSGDWLYVPRARRSQVKENISFWSSAFSAVFTLASLIVLIVRDYPAARGRAGALRRIGRAHAAPSGVGHFETD